MREKERGRDEGRTTENGKESLQEMRGEQSERQRELEQQGSTDAK